MSKIADCHPDREHHAKGLCRSCYDRRWHEKNPEYDRRYREEHPEQMAEHWRRWREKNPEYFKCYRAEHAEQRAEYDRRYYKEHAEERAEYNRRYCAEHTEQRAEYYRRYRVEHPEQTAENYRRYREKHPEQSAEHKARRRAWKLQSPSIPMALESLEGKDCLYCRKPAEVWDHFVPLARGGGHLPGNLVPACTSCNSSKGAKMPENYLVQLELA